MYVELCFPFILVGIGISVLCWLLTGDLKREDSNKTWIARTGAIIAMVVACIGITGAILYGVADTKIETELTVPVNTIDGVQYIQYNHPDQTTPVVLNVNQFYARTFSDDDVFKVQICKDGPYNGMYRRPNDIIWLPDNK